MTAAHHNDVPVIPLAEIKPSETIRPLYDWIFASQVSRHNKIGSLWVPDDKREDVQQGVVFAVGNGTNPDGGPAIPLTVKVGDRLLWAKYFEKPVDLGRNEHYAAIREKDIIAIISPDGKDCQPLYNTVAVECDPIPEKEGSIILPQQFKKPLMPGMTGTVVDCGPGHRMKDGSIEPLTVKVGSKVVLEAYGGEDHTFNGRRVRLVPEEHVLVIIEE